MEPFEPNGPPRVPSDPFGRCDWWLVAGIALMMFAVAILSPSTGWHFIVLFLSGCLVALIGAWRYRRAGTESRLYILAAFALALALLALWRGLT